MLNRCVYSCVYIDPNTLTIQQLISQARPEIAPKWYDLRVELLGEEYVKKLEVIETVCNGNTEHCSSFGSTQILNYKASWTKLVEALRSKSAGFCPHWSAVVQSDQYL